MPNRTPIHLLIMAVVQDQDIERATSAAESLGAPVVYLASTGGFLGRRNATLLIGLPEGMETDMVETLHKTCRQRVEYLTMPVEGATMPLPTPVPVTVGGATIFALPVDYFEEI
ncbi:MAG: cyclic-di-AMP receptor [Anaerolineales bacterium]